MRAHLLTTVAAAALLAAMPARAQDATWLLNPGSNTFNTATNWNPAVVPTNTAFFGASNTTSIAFQPFTTTSIGTLQFNPDAPAYIFATIPSVFTSINITGAGIVNNSSNAPTFIVGDQANLSFRNASTAGNATIITCIPAGGAIGENGDTTGVCEDMSNTPTELPMAPAMKRPAARRLAPAHCNSATAEPRARSLAMWPTTASLRSTAPIRSPMAA